MCGITGFFDTKHQLSPDSWGTTLSRMGEAIIHRGPDAGDIWFDLKDGIGLSHRRLSILDLSPAGAQPMRSHSNRFVMVFNGEIYNHLEIRDGLKDVEWRGHSDTETLLAGFDQWGVEETIVKTVGMFALAVWDNEEKILHLTRDRMGEKPLYYYQNDGLLIFGSELKAILAHPLFRKEIDRESLNLYTQYSYIPTPYSIYKNTKKLEQGSILTIKGSNVSNAIYKKYWDITSIAEKSAHNKFRGTDTEAINALENKLINTVKIQQLSDVPLGAFLSGGIDSSLVVALMQKTSNQAVKTFTIGFDDNKYNEAKHARAVANHLNTNHTELILIDEDIRKAIPLLPQIYDEPFADSSQIPTYLVSKLAREHVTVSLSGDAGDELFCGYNRYTWTNKIHNYPYSLRALAKPILELFQKTGLNKLIYQLPGASRYSLIEEKLEKLISVLGLQNEWDIYQFLLRTWNPENQSLVKGLSAEPNLIRQQSKISGFSFIENMMLYDLQTYLPDDNLHKLDRAGMAVSLESRVPFLDHRIIEFALSLPMNFKFRDGQTKWILRQILYKHVPKELIERPKMGFSVPIDSWLRGPLKEWAASLLNPDLINQDGFFNSEIINQHWKEHQSGVKNHGNKLWNVIIFQSWFRN